MFWWVESDQKEAGTIRADNKTQARKIAKYKFHGKVVAVNILPYPAAPALNGTGGIPEFCWKPNECKGHTSCPRNPCCTS